MKYTCECCNRSYSTEEAARLCERSHADDRGLWMVSLTWLPRVGCELHVERPEAGDELLLRSFGCREAIHCGPWRSDGLRAYTFFNGAREQAAILGKKLCEWLAGWLDERSRDVRQYMSNSWK